MRKIACILFSTIILFSCKRDKDNSSGTPTDAVLVLPAKNEACTNGRIVSPTISVVTFKWNKTERTDEYEVHITNLETEVQTTETTRSTEIEIPLAADHPYSWYVVSKSSASSAEGKSETWRFYNSGAGKSSYAPFPAEIISPVMGQELTNTNGKVTLDWNGSDVDNDISSYEVYFGTSKDNLLQLGNSTTSSVIEDVIVSPGNTYFWRVVTKDVKGNTSSSVVYQFNVK